MAAWQRCLLAALLELLESGGEEALPADTFTEENLLNCPQGKETYNLHGTWLSSKPWGKGKVSAPAISDRAAYCSYAAALGMGSALLLLGTRLPATILHRCWFANLLLSLGPLSHRARHTLRSCPQARHWTPWPT